MSLVVLERHDGVVSLKLNRVDKLNALSWDLIDETTTHLKLLNKEATQAKLRCLLIGSTTPKAFCTGADLKERLQMTEEKVVQTLDRLKLLMDLVDDFPMPTVAVMEGAAFGGGLELALACDLRISHPAASMGLLEVNLSVIPGAGGTQRLPRIIGEAKAKELIFLGEKVSGEQALHMGLVHTTSVDPWKKAQAWATELSHKGPLALRMAKESIISGRALPLKDALDIERGCYVNLLGSKDRIEGLRAFVEKRQPKYTGH